MVRFALLFACTLVLRAQTAPAGSVAPKEPSPVVRKHTLAIGGKTLAYTTTTGRLPIANSQGEVEAYMFFVAYTLDNPAAKRPLLFAFNGGPGAASIWLHMGALGPKIVKMQGDGTYPPPPFELIHNPHTFLPFADMVFIDPIGTGHSRAVKPETGKKFFGVEGDVASVGEFIRLWLTRYERWNSPLFLIGESYGTFRAAGVAGYLVDHGVAFNGICLISTILNYQTVRFSPGNDLPYSLFLPTYTAIAWYHKKLEPGLQGDLREALQEAEQYAGGEYLSVLAQGDRLNAADRAKAIDKLHRLTGLSKQFLDRQDLRVEIQRFTKELLRDRGKTIGRLDGRVTGEEGLAGESFPGFDPSLTAIRAPYTSLFNEYARRELGYESDQPYYALGGGIGRWDYGQSGNNRFADTGDALRQAFAKNPYMRVYVGSGYFDLATPYFASEYTLSHLGLPARYKSQVTTKLFRAGHMFYTFMPALAELTKDIESFIGGK